VSSLRLNEEKKSKWDSKAKRTRKRLSKRQKLLLLHSYEVQLKQGKDRVKALATLAKQIGVKSERQVERILAQAKAFEREIAQHHTELSVAALNIASNLDALLNTPLFTEKTGVVVYGGVVSEIGSERSVLMRRVDKHVALNLLCHLKKELPDLADIDDWGELANSRITEVLILSLRQKGNQGSFSGKCPDCPR
jgi:hypothetical protein